MPRPCELLRTGLPLFIGGRPSLSQCLSAIPSISRLGRLKRGTAKAWISKDTFSPLQQFWAT
jgi:hypothetical protein